MQAALLVAIVLAAVGLIPGTAQAQPADGCRDLLHVQTYSPEGGFFRAPAWHFGRNVTVVYQGQTCETTDELGRYVLDAKGVATIIEGSSQEGTKIERAPFRSTLISDMGGEPGDAWWACVDGTLSYSWSISGIYDFNVTGKNGTWTVSQSDPAGNGPVSDRSADACDASS